MTSTLYESQLIDIVRAGQVQLSNIRPSDWVEQNVVMDQPFPGPYRYSKTPYCREIIDCLAPDHPARWVVWMKGLQIGASAGVIIPGLGWIIKESPARTYFTVGAPELVEKAVEKLDLMIDNAGLRNYIRSQAQRARANKSGDTNTKKDFSGGYIVITSANNHKNWRDVSLKYGFFDDFEAVKSSSKESGDTRSLIEGRFAAFSDTHKIFYISTPELKLNSNIEAAYLLGDQRKFLLPCPVCHDFIEIVWDLEEDGKKKGGIYFERDNHGGLIEKSVGYVCQQCAGFFKDNNKQQQLNDGHWKPTAIPSRMGFYSYHSSSLIAPAGMYGWLHYAHKYCEATPLGQPRKEALWKTFVTTTLALTYEEEAEETSATQIQRNQRAYEPFTIPEAVSMADGNGRIVQLTLFADMNGNMKGYHKMQEDDARLDWEILAHTESGSTYSIAQGSIGTFVPGQGKERKDDRALWSYDYNHPRCVWPELDKIASRIFDTDSGRKMKIALTGVDSGNYTEFAYAYQGKSNNDIVCTKGDKEQEYLRWQLDVKPVKDSVEKPEKLYILTVGYLKDDLSNYMRLNWTEGDPQPPNFMNFPMSNDGMYQAQSYFAHYESEHRISKVSTSGKTLSLWTKKRSNSQNHFWDVRLGNLALRDILVMRVAKEQPPEKRKTFSWKDFIDIVIGNTKK
jgi:phage terminase large subunit GpA-like protein